MEEAYLWRCKASSGGGNIRVQRKLERLGIESWKPRRERVKERRETVHLSSSSRDLVLRTN
ncbi:hypothetical protein ACLOJK_003571 [Asimina triloba]